MDFRIKDNIVFQCSRRMLWWLLGKKTVHLLANGHHIIPQLSNHCLHCKRILSVILSFVISEPTVLSVCHRHFMRGYWQDWTQSAMIRHHSSNPEEGRTLFHQEKNMSLFTMIVSLIPALLLSACYLQKSRAPSLHFNFPAGKRWLHLATRAFVSSATGHKCPKTQPKGTRS